MARRMLLSVSLILSGLMAVAAHQQRSSAGVLLLASERPSASDKQAQVQQLRAREMEVGNCDANPLKMHGLGEDLAATDTIRMASGSQGGAVAQCMGSSSCKAPDLQFDWKNPRASPGASTYPGLTGRPLVQAGPSCARGDWQPLTPPPVRVAAYSSTAVFAAAGCVEMWSLQEDEVWNHVLSLPTSLDLAEDEIVPSAFGTQVSVNQGVMAVSASVRSKVTGKVAPAVALYVGISRKEWVLAEVIKCDAAPCLHTPQPCSAPGAFASPNESPTGCVGGGFGSSVAVHDQLLAVGIPNNSSVAVYKQRSTGVDSATLGKRLHVGVGLIWQFQMMLREPDETPEGTKHSAFGSAIALCSNVIVVGHPASGDPTGGALIFSALPGGTGAARFGEILLDVRQECCILELPCCHSAYAGRSVDEMELADTARIIVGDPSNDAAILVDCDLLQMKDGFMSDSPKSAVCAISDYVTAAKSYSKAQTHGSTPKVDGRGWGASVALGGEMVFFGNPSWSCTDGGKSGQCGQVCYAASCPPEYCLLYDFSVDNHICLSCTDENACKGGMEGCTIQQISVLAFLVIGILCLVSVCCCLCAVNIRLVLMTTDIAPGGWVGTLLDILCCLPRAQEDEREERLLGGEEGGGEDEVEDAQEDDPVGKGYLPPAVSKALRAMAGQRKQRDASAGAADEEQGPQKRKPPKHQLQSSARRNVEPKSAGGDADARIPEAAERVAEKNDEERIRGRHEDAMCHEVGDVQEVGEQGEVVAGDHMEGVSEERGIGAAKRMCNEEEESRSKEEEEDKEEEEEEEEEDKEEEETCEHHEDPDDGDEKIGVPVDYFTCKKCRERAIEVIFVPCGHKALCKRCAKGLKECLICKRKVTRVQTVFHV